MPGWLAGRARGRWFKAAPPQEERVALDAPQLDKKQRGLCSLAVQLTSVAEELALLDFTLDLQGAGSAGSASRRRSPE
jgi:hypothetical protein